MGNQIPIIMAANDRYAPYLGITIQSLRRHANGNDLYRIHVLEEDISDYHKWKLKHLETDNIEIEFCDVSERMKAYDIPSVNHLSKETAYRLLVDKLFPQYEKVLYLDCDIIILRDVAELYSINIGDDILGASRARLVKALYEHIKEEMPFSAKDYFNAGILLINISAFRKANIGLQGLKILSERIYYTQDQDVLNLLCHGKVKYIDGHWNVEWEHLTRADIEVIYDQSRENTLEYIYDPYIIHYTSPHKPWAHPETRLAEYFWKEARGSEFYEEVLYNNLRNPPAGNVFSFYIFPWDSIKPHSRIILYGAGNVGRVLIEQVHQTGYCQLVAVCDKRAEEVKNIREPVIVPEQLDEYEYDAILLAVKKEELAEEIRSELEELGVDPEKIRWKTPVR